MKLRGKEIIVHRGETFTLDMNIKNRDGSPFIISKGIMKPYLLISVASSKYSQSKRYLSNWWLDLTKIKRFSSTKIFSIDGFDTDTYPLEPGETGDVTTGDCYLYTDGKGNYRTWNPIEKKLVPYEFRVTKAFTYDETKEWVSRSYDYSITFIAGNGSMEYLAALWDRSWGVMPLILEDLWKAVVEHKPEVLDVMPEPTPICNYSTVLTFVEPSPLTVLADIRGSK